MRRPMFRLADSLARSIFARAHHVTLSSTDERGEPLQKTLHAVVEDDHLLFHAAPVGEKTLALGRRAVLGAVEVVAQIPSYFLDAERACPATTLYRSAQAHGELRAVDEPELKARALSALMHKFQPEGGHRPIAAEHPLYKKVLAGLLVAGVRLDHVDGKAKLMQHKSAADRAKVTRALWDRGAPGDVQAIEAIREANPDDPLAAPLAGPDRGRFVVAPLRAHAEAVASMLASAYWNDLFHHDELVRAHLSARAWVVLLDRDGQVVASARAIGDGVKHSWLYDVIVRDDQRRRGLGLATVKLLLDHPAVRASRFVHLGTRDAQALYQRLGFVPSADIVRPYTSTAMTLDRGSADSSTIRAACVPPSSLRAG